MVLNIFTLAGESGAAPVRGPLPDFFLALLPSVGVEGWGAVVWLVGWLVWFSALLGV